MSGASAKKQENTMASGESTPEMIAPLTGLRGYAALWVVISHLSFTDVLWAPFAQRLNWGWFEGILRHEYLAVDLFFMLSGFVMTHVHGREFANALRPRDVSRFLLLRLARIYPLHLLALALVIALTVVVPDPAGLNTASTLVTQTLLMSGWGFHDDISWNLPAWSLSAEWLAYLAFPVLAFATFHIRTRAGRLAALAGAFALFYVLVFHLKLDLNYSNGAGAITRVLIDALVGSLLWHMYKSEGGKPALWTVAFVLSFISALAMMTDLSGARLPDNIWAVVMMAALLLTAAKSDLRPLTGRIPQYLGKISFAVYIMHYPVLRYLRFDYGGWYANAAGEGEVWGLFALTLGVVLLISALAHELAEKPIRKWAQARIARKFSLST